MKKKMTEAEVLEAYRAAQQMKPVEFARSLGMSKQSYSSYVNKGARQDLAGLQESAKKHVGTWIGDLAVDLLIVRGAVIPCVCQTELFDNGLCPKHSHSVAQSYLVAFKGKSAIRVMREAVAA